MQLDIRDFLSDLLLDCCEVCEVKLNFIVRGNETLHTISFQADWSFGLFSQHKTDAIMAPVGVVVWLATFAGRSKLAPSRTSVVYVQEVL